MKRSIVHVVFISCLALNCYAQKLPNKQTKSLRTPLNIKIDGKSTEWGDKFQAYNTAVDVFYTISNDDSNIYLTAKATDPGIANKIIGGGITLTVITSGNKKDKNGVSITYPARDTKNLPLTLNHKDILPLMKDTIKNRGQIDSLAKVYNKKLDYGVKLIGVTGIKEISDNFISVYNDLDIKAAALFNNRINLIYELAVPLKYLGLDIDKKNKFIYQLKLNGNLAPNATTFVSGSGRFIIVQQPDGQQSAIPNISLYSAGAYVTDFWGKYSLSK